MVEEIAREVAAGSRDEELDEDETSKVDDEKDEDEDEDEHDLHDRKVSDDYMVEEVEDEGHRDGHGGDDDDNEDEEEDDHDDKEGEAEDNDKEVRDLDDEGEEDTHVLTMNPTNVPLLLDCEWVSSDSGEEGGPEKSIDLRRSTRAKSSTIKSPWMEFKVAPKTKRPKEERDIFFTLISRRPKGEEEGKMTVIKMFDEDIDRQQLFSLGRVNRVNNRVLNLVCKAVMEDMKAELGPGKRHIFDVDFMFYVAIQPNTLDFHILESMRDHFGSKDRKKKKKKVVIKDPVEMAVDDCRMRFNIILDLVKLGLVGKKSMSPMTFAERDCGVHCMMWLRRWELGVTLTYTEEEVAGFHHDLTWWLVNHEQNEKCDEALALIRQPQRTKSTKSKKRCRS
ncbi:RNA polymerase II subunit 5-mediating protein homolog [Neltuma alba]|uniref:RNA polymerase II subunit 5-mediating protein homolog n=1 Tax=Neltuma alba TaxID=207710 RepID=UPI0010A4A36F|nr:RNA polymerase II subunit 5-mediating protein homolog [Prosopis alba]